MKFNEGDIVALKSGGPSMTVAEYDEDIEQYVCQWFVGPTLQYGHFSPSVLKEVQPTPTQNQVIR